MQTVADAPDVRRKRNTTAATMRRHRLEVLRLVWHRKEMATFEVQAMLDCKAAYCSEVMAPLRRDGLLLGRYETDQEMRERARRGYGPSKRQMRWTINHERVRGLAGES